MSKKLSLLEVQEQLSEKRMYIFSPLEFRRFFAVQEKTASAFIERYLKRGFFIKLKNGLYALKSKLPSEFEIANRLYVPSYVSLEYAMMYYNIIPDTVYTITSITTKPTREFVINNISYTYNRIKRVAFSGYFSKPLGGNIVFIAEPEKAIVDYLYFVDLGKKVVYDRLDVSSLSKKKLIQYAKLFERNSLIKLLKEVYDSSRRHKEVIY